MITRRDDCSERNRPIKKLEYEKQNWKDYGRMQRRSLLKKYRRREELPSENLPILFLNLESIKESECRD
jgi:hypothetical protein